MSHISPIHMPVAIEIYSGERWRDQISCIAVLAVVVLGALFVAETDCSKDSLDSIVAPEYLCLEIRQQI